MLKKVSYFVLAVLLVAGFSFAASTDTATTSTKTTTTTTKSMTKSSMKSMPKVEGTVQKVDPATKTVSVQVGTDTKDYTYGTKTWFMSGKKRVKSTELKVGDKVSFTADSKNMIHKLEIEPATK